MLQMVLPPAYAQVLIPFREQENRGKRKTKGGPPQVVRTPVHKRGGGPKKGVRKSDGRDVVVKSAARTLKTPTVLAPQREA